MSPDCFVTYVPDRSELVEVLKDGLVIIPAVELPIRLAEPQRIRILWQSCQHRPHPTDLMLPTIAWEVSAQQQPVAGAQPAAILLEGEYVYGDVLVPSAAVPPAQHVPAFLCHDACAANDHAERRAKHVRSSVGLGIRTTHGHTEPKTTASYEHCGSEPVHHARHDG